MLQLLQRAYGTFTPTDDVWPSAEGGWVDAFRPAVDPGGLASREEVIWSREGHLAAVRELFAGCDVLVFTLGLTEGWRAKCDGAVFPVCPGCGAGTFDPERYESFNLSCAEVTDDLREIHRQLKAVNPDLRLILTVSPVPLIATHSGRHVLVATTYSKSVLRVAADEFAEGREDVCYFPSYEIITGSHARGGYYWENLRTVRPEGVEHVMRCFFRSFADETVDPLPAVKSAETDRRAAAPLFAICDEEELQRRYERNRE